MPKYGCRSTTFAAGLIQSLVNESRPAGQYTEMWDGTTNSGSKVASGMYIVHLQAGADVVTRKVVMVN